MMMMMMHVLLYDRCDVNHHLNVQAVVRAVSLYTFYKIHHSDYFCDIVAVYNLLRLVYLYTY